MKKGRNPLLAIDVFLGEVIPHKSLIPDSSRSGEDTLLVIAKELLGEALSKTGEKIIGVAKLAELAVKIGIVISNSYQDLLEDRGKNEVNARNWDRARNAKIEATQALRDKKVDALSLMNPLARDVLRQQAQKSLLKVQDKLSRLNASFNRSKSERDKAILAPQIDRLTKDVLFLIARVRPRR